MRYQLRAKLSTRDYVGPNMKPFHYNNSMQQMQSAQQQLQQQQSQVMQHMAHQH